MAISIENHKFSHPMYLMPMLKEFPLEFCNDSSAQNLYLCPYRMVERVWQCVHSFRYSTRVWQTVWQMDGFAETNCTACWHATKTWICKAILTGWFSNWPQIALLLLACLLIWLLEYSKEEYWMTCTPSIPGRRGLSRCQFCGFSSTYAYMIRPRTTKFGTVKLHMGKGVF